MNGSSIKEKAQAAIEKIYLTKLKAPQTIAFGRGKLDELGARAFPFAWKQKVFVIFGGKSADQSGLIDRAHTLLNRHVIEMVSYPGIHREPTVGMVDEAIDTARIVQPKLVIGIGGGSVIDCAKAVAALVPNDGSVAEYLEGSDTVRALIHPPLPMMAVPTTAGTGSEMTRNAVISIPEKGHKKSLRDDRMLPTIALIDPDLSLGVPPHITAAGGMDALAQLIEPCISIKRRPVVTELAHEGLKNVQLGLSVAYESPDNPAARERMSFVGMLGGVCLANAGLAMAHGIAAALGALCEMPHGLACGILLSHTLRYNRAACEEELKGALSAFLNQTEPTNRTVDDGIAAIESLAHWLQIPPNLKYLGLNNKDLEKLAEHSMGSSMGGNPIPMTPEKILAFLKNVT